MDPLDPPVLDPPELDDPEPEVVELDEDRTAYPELEPSPDDRAGSRFAVIRSPSPLIRLTSLSESMGNPSCVPPSPFALPGLSADWPASTSPGRAISTCRGRRRLHGSGR